VANKRLLESTADNAGKAKGVVAGEQMQESDGVSWQTLDSEIHLRRPMQLSQQTEHAKTLTFSQARPILGFDDGQGPAELDRQPGPAVESRRQFVQPAKSQPESKVDQPVVFKSVLFTFNGSNGEWGRKVRRLQVSWNLAAWTFSP